MDQAWLEAAHSYNRMTDAQRYDYWNRLSPEQQAALAAALEAVRDQPVAAPVAASPAVASEPAAGAASPAPVVRQTARRQPGGRTLAGTLGIGCVGMILGILGTLAVEAALISAGVNFLAALFDAPSTSSSSRPSRPSEPPSADSSTSNDDSRRDRPRVAAPNCPRTEQEWAECSIEWQKRK